MNTKSESDDNTQADDLFKRARCSSCDKYEIVFWIDEKGQCMDCQRKDLKQKALSGSPEH